MPSPRAPLRRTSYTFLEPTLLHPVQTAKPRIRNSRITFGRCGIVGAWYRTDFPNAGGDDGSWWKMRPGLQVAETATFCADFLLACRFVAGSNAGIAAMKLSRAAET
jgi:hypothetical protein